MTPPRRNSKTFELSLSMNLSNRPLAFGSLLLIAMALLAAPSSVQAFGGPPGGPFGNGSYFPNDGTFSAVVRGTNLTGTLQFSTTEGAGPVPSSVDQQTTSTGSSTTQSTITSSAVGGLGSTGIANIYYNGRTYNGNSQGAYNSSDSNMIVNFQVSSQGQGEQTITRSSVVDLGDIFESTTTINTDGSSVTVNSITPQRSVVPSSEITYFDTFYMNGFANCKTSNAFPNQKFKGKGEFVAQELSTGNGNFDPIIVQTPPTPISVTGVRLSNTASSFNTASVRPPSVTSATILVAP